MKWEKPDEEGLVKFMCETNGFQEDRIRNGAKKLLKARQGSTQGRLDSFFKVSPAALPSDQIAKLYTIPYRLFNIRIAYITTPRPAANRLADGLGVLI